MSSFFAKTNNYKDYFLSDNNGQSIPLASLILVPCVTLFLAYSTLVSKSDKNKENVTDNLDPINTDEDEDEDKDNDEDKDKDDTNDDDTNDSIINNDKKSPITITQGGKQRQNKKSKTIKKKTKKSKTIKKKNRKSKTIKKK